MHHAHSINLVEYDPSISPKKHEIKQLANDIGLSCLLAGTRFFFKLSWNGTTTKGRFWKVEGSLL